MFYIYGLREAGSDEYRYVGRTKRLAARLRQHKSMNRDGKQEINPQLAAWLHMIDNAPIMDILEAVPRFGRQHEQRWIDKLLADGHDLLNMKPASFETSGFSDVAQPQKTAIVAYWLDSLE